MVCDLKNKLGDCFSTRKKCKVEDYKTCKYYLREHPVDKKLFKLRFYKALKKALYKRDLFKEHPLLLDKVHPDYSLSIYENVNDILKVVDNLKISIKEKRKLTKEDLEGNILKNITSNLYDTKEVKIVQRHNQGNSIIVIEDNGKYICNIKSPLDKFFNKLKKTNKKDKYLESQIKEKVKI